MIREYTPDLISMREPHLTSFPSLTFNPRFEYGDQASAAPISGADQLTELGTGFGRLTNANFPWTIKYDEVLLVIEGELTVHTENQQFTAKARDTIWLPKGTSLRYEAREALIFYAIHPANWAES